MNTLLTNPHFAHTQFHLVAPVIVGLRLLGLVLVALTLLHTQALAASVQSPSVSRILVLGDSLSAAYGIPLEQGWVNLMRKELGDEYSVVNASISGETTGGGLRALPRLLEEHKPDLVIIELGANDGLRGFPLAHMRNNLAQMIELVVASNAQVVLVGMHIPPNYGPAYTQAFHQTFQKLADEYQLPLLPFLLDKVALEESLMQDDRLHPTAEAQPLIKENIMQVLLPFLGQAS